MVRKNNKQIKTTVLLIVTALSFFACAKTQVRAPESVLDNPERHYSKGMNFLERDHPERASREFQLALELAPRYAPAYVGEALLASKRHDFETALARLDAAQDLAKTGEHKTLVHTGRMRVLTARRGENWLDDVEEEFKSGIKLSPKEAALYYYMGRAHKLAYRFEKAEDDFKRVLELNRNYVTEANREWELVQKIRRAAPGSKIGKEIALIEKIDRADTAALFIQELKLDKLIARQAPRTDSSFRPPAENNFPAQSTVKAPEATDIEQHVLRADIEEAIQLKLRGLSPFPDHTFRPDERLTRASFAVMLEDIIIAITKENKLATKFIGETSPFPDLRNDHWAFNAIMTATSRGIMGADDTISGEFRPQEYVSGAEALLIIRRLKEKLQLR